MILIAQNMILNLKKNINHEFYIGSVWILIVYLVWLMGIITIDYFVHLNDATNRLSNSVIIALASSTAVAIVGLPSLIVKSLFK